MEDEVHNEFYSEKEYYRTYLDVREALEHQGWHGFCGKRGSRIISEVYTKNGYSMNVIYGCTEDVKDELL